MNLRTGRHPDIFQCICLMSLNKRKEVVAKQEIKLGPITTLEGFLYNHIFCIWSDLYSQDLADTTPEKQICYFKTKLLDSILHKPIHSKLWKLEVTYTLPVSFFKCHWSNLALIQSYQSNILISPPAVSVSCWEGPWCIRLLCTLVPGLQWPY